MTLLPEVREQLLDAAFGPAESRPRRARGQRSGRFAIVLSIAVSVAVAAVFLLSRQGSTPPSSSPATGPTATPPPAAWVNALGRAGESTRQRDPACRLSLQLRGGGQRFSSTVPPRSITAIVPSLASPPPPALRVTVRELRALHVNANGIYARYAWQGHSDGIDYYVVPAAVVGATNTPPARCYREELAAFREQARRLPPGQRAAAIAYAQQRFSPGAAAGVSIVIPSGAGRSEVNTPAVRLDTRKGDPIIARSGFVSESSTTTVLLVTDQVASVTATYPAQSRPGRVARTFSVTKRPVRNLVIFHLAGKRDQPRLTFRSITGAVIGRTPDP